MSLHNTYFFREYTHQIRRHYQLIQEFSKHRHHLYFFELIGTYQGNLWSHNASYQQTNHC